MPHATCGTPRATRRVRGRRRLGVNCVSLNRVSINYDGRIFRSLANTAGGDVGGDTLFHYHQRGHIVWATYQGGQVAFGTLIAIVSPEDDSLDMRYQHVSADRTLKTGRCRSTPLLLPDGRLRLRELWQWTEGGTGAGESEIEEVLSPV